MIVFPNCKINLGLHIISKRADGYHNLETFFYPVPLTDALEIITNNNPGAPAVTLTGSGFAVNVADKDHLCVKAYQLLKNDFPDRIPPIFLHLHKHIPMGAGLGGGSSNGAFTLLLLNQLYQLELTQQVLGNYALQLGSDCPFFIINSPSFASGRGEQLSPSDFSLAGYKLLLVNPGIHVSTASAFAGIKPKLPKVSLQEIIAMPITDWQKNLQNDFETSVFLLHPSLAYIKSKLYDSGAVYAAMTGSGSTVFGIFKETVAVSFPGVYFQTWLSL